MRVLGLDLGTNMGWAVVDKDTGLIVSGSFTLSGGHRDHKFSDLHVRLNDMYVEVEEIPGVELIMYERPFTRGLSATRLLWGLAGIVGAVATSWDLPVVEVLPSTIKKHATGRGDADKDAMMAAVVDNFFHEPTNEHEADAIWAADYAAQKAVRYVSTGKRKGRKKDGS